MKPKLILVSHGLFAQQLYASAEMIMGELTGVYSIAMLASDGLEGTREKLQQVLTEIGPDAPILILVDMFFGTPCNISVEAMCARDNVCLLTGLNLPMVLEYAVTDEEDVRALAEYLREVGTGSIQIVERPVLSVGEEGYED